MLRLSVGILVDVMADHGRTLMRINELYNSFTVALAFQLASSKTNHTITLEPYMQMYMSVSVSYRSLQEVCTHSRTSQNNNLQYIHANSRIRSIR